MRLGPCSDEVMAVGQRGFLTTRRSELWLQQSHVLFGTCLSAQSMKVESAFSLVTKLLVCSGNFMEMGIPKTILSSVNLPLVGKMQLINIFGRSD